MSMIANPLQGDFEDYVPPSVKITSSDLNQLATVLEQVEAVAVAKGEPTHEKQQKLIAAPFLGKTFILANAGRRSGKSTGICRLLWIWGRIFPGSMSYFFASENIQAYEILWATRVLQEAGPEDWVEDELKSEMRLIWNNGSQVKLGGADRYDKRRGIEPRNNGLVILDEFRDYKDDFFYTIRPILAKHNSPLIITSTPPPVEKQKDAKDPTKDCLYIRLIKQAQEQKRGVYLHFTSFDNPGLSREFLEQERRDLIEDGKEHIWLTEYMAQFVNYTSNSVFPMFSEGRHVFEHELLVEEVREIQKRRDLRWVVMCDPAYGSVFAWMFLAFDDYTGNVYVLDEIYERDRNKCITSYIWPCASRIMEELLPDMNPAGPSWSRRYDEAELWFQVEIKSQFGVDFLPTYKFTKSKNEGIDLMASTIARDFVKISKRCKYFIWEVLSYRRDDRGNYPKKDDHQIDNFRGFQRISNYNLRARASDLPNEKVQRRAGDPRRRLVSIDYDLREMELQDIWIP